MLRSLLAVLVVAVVPAAHAVASESAPSTDYQRVVDITFPVSGRVSYWDTYHADRSGGARKHQGTDVMAPKLQGLHAAVDGTVCTATGISEPMPSYGYYLSVCGDDGLRYNYVHLNNDSPGTDDGAGGPKWAYAPGIKRGVRVQRGQWLGYVGDSGNAESTPPHLHFEIVDSELNDPRLAVAPYKMERIDPYPSLKAAQARGDVPAPPDGGGGSPAPQPTTSPKPTNSPAPAPQPTSSPKPAPQPTNAPAPAPQPAPEPAGVPMTRAAGGSRVETAISLASARDPGVRAVVVVPAGSPTEALLAAPLAALVDAPVLLTGPDGLDAPVRAEIERLRPASAYLVGRTDQLAGRTEDDLAAAGVGSMARLAAPNRYELSATIAREIMSYPSVNALPEVLVALGEAADPSRAWPDALSATALAARLRVPILLARTDELPQPVEQVLAELRPRAVRVIGGPAAVSDAVAAAAARAAGGASTSRLAGKTRYGTSVAVAQAGVEHGLTQPSVFVATGRNFPDALAAGPAAARSGAPLLLVDGAGLAGSPESAAWLKGQAGRVSRVTVVGGAAAVSDAAAREVSQALAG